MDVTICNPLLRTPLALIIDDSCPCINKAYYWIKQRHEWRLRNRVTTAPAGWERHADKLGEMPQTIPADFAKEWGEWCGENGLKGKFSLIPFPAGVGRIDQGSDLLPEPELANWLDAAREAIQPNFDLTPEMLTHTHVVDLDTWTPTEEWEQGEWVDPPVDRLPDYIAAAMQILRNVGIECEGVTSPGAFGSRQEDAYSRAILDAAMRVNGVHRPFYFLHMTQDELPTVPIHHVRRDEGAAVASIVGCAGDWFGATGYDTSDADLFITEDLAGGRVPQVLAAESPCIMVGHWPCFYANGGPGFDVLKTVKRRLDAYDPDGAKTIWMKCSEIGRYWMARELSEVAVAQDGGRAPCACIAIATHFPTPNFTLSLDVPAKRVQVGGHDLREVGLRRDFAAGTFMVEGRETFVAFDLAEGATEVAVHV